MATIKFKRGGGTPTGLTAGEPAWQFSTNQVYLGVTSDPPIWVGAKIEDSPTWASGSTLMLATQNAINTQFMPKSGGTFTGIVRVQNQIGVCFGDADSTNYIGIRAPTTVASNYTLTLPDTAGGASEVLSTDGSGNLSWVATGAATTVSVTDLNATNTTIYLAGATSDGSRTLYIDTTGLTYNANTNLLANNGALSLGGNLTVAGTSTLTGNVTASGDLTVTGNLTINGTTTTVNSNTMTVDDPLIILGTSGGLPISASDSDKDRGIVFNYFANSAGRTGFFGFDASTTRFTYVAIGATLTNEIVTGGTAGDAQFRSLYLTMPSGAFVGGLTLGALSADRTYTLPNVSGTIITTGDSGTVTNTMIATDAVTLGTQTTGNYVATLSTTSSGLTLANSGAESAAVTVNFTKINTGIDFGTFAFTTNEFTNTSGTVAIGTVDGGSY